MTSTGSLDDRERLRLFCALRLPEKTLDALEAWQADHLQGRIVPRENLHVTLAFLGSTPRSELEGVVAALETATRGVPQPVFTAGRYRETRSVGMVELADRTDSSGRTANGLFEELERLGVYEREQRRWLPHVTVLRFRERPWLQPPTPELGVFSPSEAAVYISRLRPSGAQYEVLESVPLGG
jgi:2'-5' RNA ligase